jgi:hypothetical protein
MAFEWEGSGLKTSRFMSGVVGAVLAVTLAGCDRFGGRGQGGGGEARQPSGEVQQGSGQAPAQPGKPIVTQEVHNAGATLRLDLTGLKRNDRLITLSWNLTVTKVGTDGTWCVCTHMSTDPISGYDVSAVTLVDPVNSKRYLVARSGGNAEEQGRCVCSTTESTALQTGESVSFFATFTAPPPDVTKVNVDLVALGSFNDVPIS